MHFFTLLGLLAPLTAVLAADGLKIDKTLTHVCKRSTQKGDSVAMHYIGTLASDGTEFDQSYKRGKPLTFKVGSGMVIKGWDQGLLGMCPGDKRTLTIPPELGYGANGAGGVIPGGATLIFQTELVSIDGVEPEEKVLDKAEDKASEPEPKAEESPVADEASSAEAEKTPKEEL